jgi:hypothetical protein
LWLVSSPATFRPGPWNASGWAGPVNPTLGTHLSTLGMLTNIFISTTRYSGLKADMEYLPINRPPDLQYHPTVPRAVVHSFLLHVARKTKRFSISSIATIGQSVSPNGTMEHDTPFSRPVRSDGTLLPIFQSGRTRCQWLRMDVGFPSTSTFLLSCIVQST